MSDANKPPAPLPDAAAPSPAVTAADAPKAVPAATKPAPEPVIIAPGPVCTELQRHGLTVEPLGEDANRAEMIRLCQTDALDAAAYLKASLQFDLLMSVTGVDLKTHRESVYHVFSTERFKYLTLKIAATPEDMSPSLYSVWPAVDWHEREAYDLLGIQYEGHPNLTRILMPNDWLGHPLRKDYTENDPRLVWNRR
jgi:NADH:ubiquinone oxidoreductase subunit C